MKRANTFTAQIYMAGDAADARRICREYCRRGLCVTVETLDFIYTGGSEAGIRVGLINYPRFPTDPERLLATAVDLANALRDGLCQHSWSIVTPTETLWDTLRAESQ